MGGRIIPAPVVEYVQAHPVLSALGTGVALHVLFRLIIRAFLAWCAGEGVALAQEVAPAMTTAMVPTALPVGDLSWPAVILALGYMLRGWTPAITVRLERKDDKGSA